MGRAFIEKCIGVDVYVLSDLALRMSMGNSPYKYIDVFYKCVQSVCKLPNIGICNLYGVLSGEGNILSLYLRDKHRFVDYYSVVLNNFENNLKRMLKLVKVPRKSIDMLNLRFGLITGTPRTIKNIATMYGLAPSTVSKTIDSTLEELKKYVVYDSSGVCTFGRKVRKGSIRGGGQLTVKSIDVDILSNPYNTTFKDINAQNMLSNRAYYCLARKGINNFEELHDYLVSVYDGKSADYIKGLYSIKTLGRGTAKEIYDLSLYLGVAEKVFNK